RFTRVSVPWKTSTRPHFRNVERCACRLPAELFENAAKTEPQIRAHYRCKPDDDQTTERSHNAQALQFRGDAAHSFHPGVQFRPKIDQRRDHSAVRKQGLAVQLPEYSIGNAETIRPDESPILLDAPSIADIPASHLLAVSCTAQYKPFESEDFSAGR